MCGADEFQVSAGQGFCSKHTVCAAGERVTSGRVDAAAVREAFGDGWGEGAYFLVVGTKDMERAAWAWLDELGYSRRLLSGSARWAPFVPA